MVKTTDAGQLPVGLAAYKRTQVFDQDGLPAALQENHRTKAGVWGLILFYRVSRDLEAGSIRVRTSSLRT